MTRSLVTMLVLALAASGCSSEPGPEESRASAEEMHDAVVDAVLELDVVRTAVRDAGWTEEGPVTQVYATKGELRISANEAKAEPGTLAIEVKHDCIEADRDVVDELISGGDEQIIG